MDKDLIRIIIFAIGLLVIIGMIAWSYIKHEKLKQNYDDYNDLSTGQEDSELGYLEDDIQGNGLEEENAYSEGSNAVDADDAEQTPRSDNSNVQVAPAIKKTALIQLSIVARSPQGFNGAELFNVLDDAGLEYGNLQIFERLDARRLVDFGVASMVKPGIFPSVNLAAFHSPGIVFFMQPSKVDNPLLVFDDFIRTFEFVASRLGGEMWDQHREPLTEETVAQLRHSLSSH
jgi:cell division protein ZipA